VVYGLCNGNEIDKDNYDFTRRFFARVLGYDIFVLQLCFHPLPVVLTLLHEVQEQQYA